MKKSIYNEMSQTAEGRKEVHDIMLSEVRAKLDAMVANAPEANREKVSKLFNTAFAKISELGNGNLFTLFADDEVSARNFVLYVQDVLNGKIH